MNALFHVFRYRVDFHQTSLDDPESGAPQAVGQGAFSEVSGLEASMEPFAIKEGGRYWGEIQRPGVTTFATLVLKRGMTSDRSLWTWFQGVAAGAFAYRLNARVVVMAPPPIGEPGETPPEPDPLIEWEFANCLPVKCKAADLSASSSDIGIEELHLAHEGMRLITGAAA